MQVLYSFSLVDMEVTNLHIHQAEAV